MFRRTLLRAHLGLAVVALAGAWPSLGCLGCPDLYYLGWIIDVQESTGSAASELSVTAVERGSGHTACDEVEPTSCNPAAGVYDLSFVEAGTEVATLAGVCTLGDQTGCEAEDAEERGPGARVEVTHDGTSWTATLQSQGPCP